MNPSSAETTDTPFQQLLARVAETPSHLRFGNQRVAGVHIDDELPEIEFVEPEISRPDGAAEAPVILISAAAAVGKSTLANEIVKLRGAPLWRLGEFPMVGSFAVSGSMSRAYGLERAHEAQKALRGHSLTLILDGLDEAVVNSGYGVIDALAKDLAEFAGANARGATAQFVVLARPDTITYLRDALAFAVPRLEYDILTVRPLARDAAVELVRRRLEELYRPSERTSGAPLPGNFDLAMETLWDEFGRVFHTDPADLFEDEGARSFVGYPPVLGVLATYLFECGLRPNLSGASRLGQLFSTILRDTILTRERGKVVDNLSAELSGLVEKSVGGPTWLSPEHQCELLVAEAPTRALRPPEGFPASRSQELIDAAMSQLTQHPFVAGREGAFEGAVSDRFLNVAFRDYAVASVMRHQGDSRPAEALFIEGGASPSPVLARLLLSDSSNHESAPPRVTVEWLPFIHLSSMAEAARQDRQWLTRIVSDRGDPDVAMVSLGAVERSLEFEVEDLDVSEVVLVEKLSNAEIRLHDRTDVRLGGVGASQGLILGPGVALEAGSVTIDAHHLRVHASRGELVDPVEIIAAHIQVEDSASFNLDGVYSPEGSRREDALLLIGSTADYRLAPYERAPRGDDEWPPDELMEIRKIVRFLAGAANGVADPVRNAAAKGSLDTLILEFLVERQILVTEGYKMTFDADRAGFSRPQIVSLGERTKALDDLVSEYRRRHPPSSKA